MNAVLLKNRGGPEALVYGPTAAVPRAGTGEVVVRVRAAAVTPTELLWATTWTTRAGGPRPLPVIPGHEFSGEVHELGLGATGLAEGTAVFGTNDWFRDGAQAEFCVARVTDLAIKPASVGYTLAAATPISALTAWQGLHVHARLAPGERVLVHGAAGGVGSFAVQLARRAGASVVGTASARNLAFVRGLGADEVIDYRAGRFEDAVRGVDVVFDTVGGETLARSWGVLRPGGRMVTVAASSEGAGEPRVKEAFFIVEPSGTQLARLAGMIDAGELRATVDAVLPLGDARQAYERKPARGKVVLAVPG